MIDDPDERGDRRSAYARSLLAGVLVAAGHVAAFAWLTTHALSTSPPDSVLGKPIELDLLAVAPPEPAPAPPPPTPEPTPTQEPAAPPPSPDPTPEAPPPPEVQPTPEPSSPPPPPEAPPPPEPSPSALATPEEPPPPPAPDPTPELPTPTPTPTPTPVPTPTTTPPAAAVVAPSPRPPRPAAKPQPPKPRPAPQPKPDPEKAERAEAKLRARELRRQQRSDAANRATRDDSRSTAAPRPPASGSDVATWRGEVMARIGEFKPASSGASGTAIVAFSVDSGGRVVSASVVRSSGDASLDAASVSMVRRASPVPAPPAGLGGRVNLTVPVRFQ